MCITFQQQLPQRPAERATCPNTTHYQAEVFKDPFYHLCHTRHSFKKRVCSNLDKINTYLLNENG